MRARHMKQTTQTGLTARGQDCWGGVESRVRRFVGMMRTDIRENAARYYDLSPEHPDDIPLYEQRIPSPGARILELGCGTGRVLIPLAAKSSYILGVDISGAMLSVCRQKLAEQG